MYLDEFILNPDGIKCRVLNPDLVDFTHASIGRKSAETIVLRANGGEKIETVNGDGLVESTYVANLGDAIFYNNEHDIYVPRDSNGNAFLFDNITDYGYEISTDLYNFGSHYAVKVKSTKTALLLPNIISEPTCIKDAWGQGQHQFLFLGATLKKDSETGKVTGIDKDAFDKTWEIFKGNNKKYESFNYFSFQYDDIYDYEYHFMSGSITESELEKTDDTLRIVEEIESKINQCGEMLMHDKFLLAEYDEDGNIIPGVLEENDEERKITLFGFPGIFLEESPNRIINFSTWRVCLNYFKNELFDSEAIKLVNMAYKGKYPIKLMVHPNTFWADHFDELLAEGIDAKHDFITGVVDIDLLCKTLQKKGIMASVTTANSLKMQAEMDIRAIDFKRRNASREPDIEYWKEFVDALEVEQPPNLEYPTTSQYLNNLINTRMESSIIISIPFGKYLRDRINREKTNTRGR